MKDPYEVLPHPGTILTDEKGRKFIIQGWRQTHTNCGDAMPWTLEHFRQDERTKNITQEEIDYIRRLYMDKHFVFYLKVYETEEDRNLP